MLEKKVGSFIAKGRNKLNEIKNLFLKNHE